MEEEVEMASASQSVRWHEGFRVMTILASKDLRKDTQHMKPTSSENNL